MRLLIIEDDANINALLKEVLTKNDYDCDSAYSGTEAVLLLEQRNYDLIMLDLMLPGLSGEEVLKNIREKSNIPVIVITAKDTIDDKVDMLKNGADDYITKPFDMKEVIARIEVQLRHSSKENLTGKITQKDMTLDVNTHSINVCGQELKKITKQEFEIVRLLMSNPKQVFSKEAIFEYAWDELYMGETKTLDVHISNIRKKIKEVTDEEYIETVWGIGYKFKL